MEKCSGRGVLGSEVAAGDIVAVDNLEVAESLIYTRRSRVGVRRFATYPTIRQSLAAQRRRASIARSPLCSALTNSLATFKHADWGRV